MEEIVQLLKYIVLELQETNSKLEEIKGSGAFSSISDICEKIDSLEDKLYDIESMID